MRCPTCSKDLIQKTRPEGYSYYCEGCQGEMYSVSVLLKMNILESVIEEVRKSGFKTDKREGRACPHCAKPMYLHYPSNPDMNFSLEICISEGYIWLDKGKLEKFPLEAAKKELSEESLMALKLLEIEEQRFLGELDNKSRNANTIRKHLFGFIPGAMVGMLLSLLIAAKMHIFSPINLFSFALIGAVIGGSLGYYLKGKFRN